MLLVAVVILVAVIGVLWSIDVISCFAHGGAVIPSVMGRGGLAG